MWKHKWARSQIKRIITVPESIPDHLFRNTEEKIGSSMTTSYDRSLKIFIYKSHSSMLFTRRRNSSAFGLRHERSSNDDDDDDEMDWRRVRMAVLVVLPKLIN